MDEVTVTIPAEWVRRVKSPLMYVVYALTGVSITFAPLFLFQLGQSQTELWNPLVVVCFAVIYLVPAFYMKLASIVLLQLHKLPDKSDAHT